jgi:putative membrane protein
MTSHRVRIVLLCGIILVLTGSGFAQLENPTTGASPAPGAAQQSGMPGDTQGGVSGGMTGPQMRDRAFIRDAVAGGLADIHMGQLALQKSSNEDVKKFAQIMVDDHTAMNDQMHVVADSMGVSLSRGLSKADQVEYDKLKTLSGGDFDKEYITQMVKAHREDQHAFRVEFAVAEDPLKEQVAKAIVLMRQHLPAVTKIAEELGISVPRPPAK